MTIENIKSTVCDRTRRLLRLLLTEAIDVVVGSAAPYEKTFFDYSTEHLG